MNSSSSCAFKFRYVFYVLLYISLCHEFVNKVKGWELNFYGDSILKLLLLHVLCHNVNMKFLKILFLCHERFHESEVILKNFDYVGSVDTFCVNNKNDYYIFTLS